MLQGGTDRNWLRPVEHDELTASEQAFTESGTQKVIGDHRGHHSALNIRNPKPDHQYYYPRRKAGAVQAMLNEGWEVVASGDQEQWGAELPEGVQQELDGMRAYQDVILMRTPMTNYRRIQVEKSEAAEAQHSGVDAAWRERGMAREAELGTPEAGSLYYVRSKHAMGTREG